MDEKRKRLNDFLSYMQIVPISIAIEFYAVEKARLRSIGENISDFDLLIGATAVQSGMTMVTNNAEHLGRIQGIQIEDWTVR